MKKKLTILTYHRVLEEADPYRDGDVLLPVFDGQMRMLSRFYRVMTLAEATRAMNNGGLPSRAVVITFDDGYADNHDLALPVLQKYGIAATFFVATSFLDGGRMWNDIIIDAVAKTSNASLDLNDVDLGVHDCSSVQQKNKAIHELIGKLKYLPMDERLQQCRAVQQKAGVTLGNNLMMSSEKLRAMAAAGMEIGGHTVNHPILSRVDDDTAAAEISEGKKALEVMIDQEVVSFAYPNGRPGQDFEPRHAKMVEQAGFNAAVTTERGIATEFMDRFQLPRFTSWDRSAFKFLLRMIHGRWIAY